METNQKAAGEENIEMAQKSVSGKLNVDIYRGRI
jgi:hypothetical protein